MKKVFLIFMQYEDKNLKVSHFRPEVFSSERLATEFCNYLSKFTSETHTKYSVIRTNLYEDIAYVKEICVF